MRASIEKSTVSYPSVQRQQCRWNGNLSITIVSLLSWIQQPSFSLGWQLNQGGRTCLGCGWYSRPMDPFQYPPSIQNKQRRRFQRTQLDFEDSSKNNDDFDGNDCRDCDDDESRMNSTLSRNQSILLQLESDDNNSSESSSSSSSSSSSRFSPFKLNQIPLTQVLEELDKCNVPYDPSSTRFELEALLAASYPSNTTQLQQEEQPWTLSKRSISSLFEQLDANNISYPPNASRQQLEEYLLESTERNAHGNSSNEIVETRQQSGTDERSLEVDNKNAVNKDFAPSSIETPNKPFPLQDVLAQLDARNVHYMPTATYQELMHLLQQSDVDASSEQSSPTIDTLRYDDLQLVDDPFIPDDNEQLPITSASTSSLAMEEQDDALLLDDPFLEDNVHFGESIGTTSPSGQVPRSTSTSKKSKQPIVSLRTILNELDQRQIRYSPDASREQLGLLLRESNRHIRRRRHRRLQRRKSLPSLSFLPSARRTMGSFRRRLRPPKGVKQVATKVIQQARYLKRDLEDRLTVDDQGVKEVEWFFESKHDWTHATGNGVDENRPIDVKAVPVNPNPQTRNSQTAKTRNKRSKSNPEPLYRPNMMRKVIIPPSPPSSSPISQKVLNPRLLLPPSRADSPKVNAESHNSPPSQKRQRRRNERRIFSPYVDDDNDDELFVVDTRDAFDRFGDAVANIAETVLWGPTSGNGEVHKMQDEVYGPASPSRRSTEVHVKENNRKRRVKTKSKARYWKDRLEEQVDHFLGIHDNESEYNDWEKEVGTERKHVTENSKKRAFSRTPSTTKSKKVPLWEEEGSLVSLLFGRRPSGGQLKLERFFEEELGTTILTNMISSLLKGGLLLASYLCRWASVKGAIPQPVVVMAVASMLASAPRGQRFKMIAFTLLILRTLGELIHGYIQGDQDWEDSNAYEFSREESSNQESPTSNN